MKKEDLTIPYQLNVFYGLDGLPVAAQIRRRRRVTLDGELMKDEELPAEHLELDDFPTSTLMTDTAKDTLVQITKLTVRVDELVKEVNAAADTLETANEHIALLTQENETLIAELDKLKVQIIKTEEPK